MSCRATIIIGQSAAQIEGQYRVRVMISVVLSNGYHTCRTVSSADIRLESSLSDDYYGHMIADV